MAIRTVGPTSTYPSIAAAMLAAGPNDTILLEAGYSNETTTVAFNGMIVSGGAGSLGINLTLDVGVTTFSLTGTAPINVHDSSGGNMIVGNAGNNVVTVTNGADAVDGGLGTDRLVVDYRLATGAITGDSTSNFDEAGTPRLVTITNGTFEHFTVMTGSGADTITTGAGDDVIYTYGGTGTVTAGQGSNTIIGGDDADTITALDGGNYINGGNGTNTLTSGGGNDIIDSGTGADTIIAGAGTDLVTVRGGADGVDGDAGNDRLDVNYSTFISNVTGGITGGNLGAGYVGHVGDGGTTTLDFVDFENFTITTGSGNDTILTGDGTDVLNGGLGNDQLTAGGGNDSLNGGGGMDSLNGGLGNDIYIINRLVDGATYDTITEAVGAGTDTVQFTGNAAGQSYTLTADVEHLVLLGSLTVNGTGNDRPNSILGNSATNVLNGGLGLDTLTGGLGNDYFLFNTALSAANKDAIADFNVADDTIRLDNAIFSGLVGAPNAVLSAGQFNINNNNGLALDAEDRIIYDQDHGRLWYDSNGSAAGGTIVNFASTTPYLTLTNADFFIV